jgi:hypothetical protein
MDADALGEGTTAPPPPRLPNNAPVEKVDTDADRHAMMFSIHASHARASSVNLTPVTVHVLGFLMSFFSLLQECAAP